MVLQIVILMAGRGQRFKDAGYILPKPLLNIFGKPMIQKVVENIKFSEKVQYTFLVLKEHYESYCLNYILNLIAPNCNIIQVETVTQGACCTVLLAKDLINNDNELLLVNSDQLVKWVPDHFLQFMREENADGGILTFQASDPKWSYAKVQDNGLITEVAEKNPISSSSTCGLYYFKTGKSFIEAAEQMISKNIRTRGEFYVCPVFNELIGDGKKIYNYPIPKMIGLGDPESLTKYLNS